VARQLNAEQAQTTAQRLDSIVKSARKIMRKDKGLNGDLDRLPMLTWIMFLKFLDDMERMEEEKAEMSGKRFKGAIDSPYRWRDWASEEAGITGPDLLRFLTADETTLPDGSKGPGLFSHLKALRGESGRRDRKDVVATVFRGLTNRMESGYLLRDVINLVNGIHFDSSEEIHTLGRLYETLLREMRDAAGDSGEFYTPRPIVRFMVQVSNPQLGEKVLDPACAFLHMAGQADTIGKRQTLQDASIYGGEAKSLPFLLVQMNLLLHGLEAPQITPDNSLNIRLMEIGEGDRFDVILSNPPFGGEEETGILNNFPEDRRTTETALLFLQMIMRRLKRNGKGRAAVVVPHGVLFGGGIAARIKADLIKEFNLHTILRLPEGVFAPYTDIPTNIIFFDTAKRTDEIWFYEQPKPIDRRKYTKTAPLTFDDMQVCLHWWNSREANEQAWKVPSNTLIETDESGRVVACNLDIRNPTIGSKSDLRAPTEILDSILAKEKRIIEIMAGMKRTLSEMT